MEIKKTEVHKKTLFYLEKGTSAPTALDIVKKHRRAYQLYIPINVEDDEESMEGNMEEKITKEETDEDLEDLSDAHASYDWGDITAAEAGEKLRDEEPGTFLLRKNDGVFKLSWKSFSSKLLHSHITVSKGKTGDLFSLSQSPEAHLDSLHELVMFYQQKTRVYMNALGFPLKTGAEDCNSRKHEPESLMSYQGTMLAEDAEKSLRKEPDGTYLVRKNFNGEYRITYKQENRCYHLIITDLQTEYRLYGEQFEGGMMKTKSLRGIIDKLKIIVTVSVPLVQKKTYARGNSVRKTANMRWKETTKKVLHESDDDENMPELAQVMENLKKFNKEK